MDCAICEVEMTCARKSVVVVGCKAKNATIRINDNYGDVNYDGKSTLCNHDCALTHT